MSRIVRARTSGDEKRVQRAVALAEDKARTLVANAEASAAAIVAAARLRAHGERERTLVEANSEIADLALVAAEKIIAEEITLHPDRIEAIVAEALHRTRRAHSVTLRVHPSHGDVLKPAAKDLNFALELDENLTPGGCVVVTDRGSIDARIEVQLEALRRALHDGDQRE